MSSSSSTSRAKAAKINYTLGQNHFPINMSIFHDNRQRLVARLKKDHNVTTGLIFLEGGKQTTRYSSDTDELFRQESFFYWAFGVRDPDCFGAIDISTGAATLMVPVYPDAYKIWFGEIRTPDHYVADYGVEQCIRDDDVGNFFKQHKDLTIYRLKGVNTDSKSTHPVAVHSCFDEIADELSFNDTDLWKCFVETRVIKSEAELDVLRHVTKLSSNAHKRVMKDIRPGWGEFQAESLFLHDVYSNGGCRHVAYCCISASGPNGAILHYGHAGEPNSKGIKDGDMCLFDMGGEYHCYCSDITCSFPVNGKFTDDQKIVYQAAYNAWNAVSNQLKEGVSWSDMHKLAETEILKHLKQHNLLKGDIDDMMRDRLGALFMPHGLGHFIGHDVHDVGGYMDHTPKRSTLPGLCSLRTSRVMERNMCITIEPGCYFVWSVIQDSVNNEGPWAQYLNMEELSRFENFGGVRIESDVIVHEDCCEDMCSVPRTIEEIEEHMKREEEEEKK